MPSRTLIKKALFYLLMGILLFTLFIFTNYVSMNQAQSLLSIRNKKRVTKWEANSIYSAFDNSHTIFFHEVSGLSSLNLRQSCSLESAARNNPDRTIKLLMKTNREDFDYSAPWVAVFEEYPNVAVSLVNKDNLQDYFSDTSLKEWLYTTEWAWSRFKEEHLSQFMILATLLKSGGLFLDLDFITTKSLKENVFWNAFIFQDDEKTMLSSSMFHLEHKHPIIDTTIQKFIETYDPDSFVGRSYIIPNFLIDLCIGTFVARKVTFTECNNVTLLPHNYCYPVPYWSWQKIFQNITNSDLKFMFGENNYGLNTWNTLSKQQPLVIGSNQMYSLLAAQHCPITASKHKEFTQY